MAVDVRWQRRTLAAAALIDSFGDGLFLAGSALFFIRGLGLTVFETGTGLTLAGIIGLLIGAESGRLADRYGARTVFVAMMLVQSVAVGAYVLVTNLAGLVLTASVAAVCRQGAQAARGALTAQLGGADAAGLRAYLHAVVNVGIAGGAGLAGLAIARDTHEAYLALMLVDAATFAAAALLSLRLPRTSPMRDAVSGATARPARKRSALSDRRFVGLTALSVIVSLQFVVSGYLLPLWVVFHTVAPRWLASPLLLLNTAFVVMFQVAASRRFRGVVRAGEAYRIGGLLLLGSCLLFGAADIGHSVAQASGFLVAAMVVASLGEVVTIAGAVGVSFGLAPTDAMGEYQGVWNLGFGLSVAVGPALLTIVCLHGGSPGWAILGLSMAASASLMCRIVRRAPQENETVTASSAPREACPHLEN
ncbi:MAG: MFS transporter [Actinomycetota bacterium]|nr:MFS transporter [Actinomycetota bacterium]